MFRNNNKTLKQELMQAIVNFQKTLETTPGAFNTQKTVTRGAVSQAIFIKLGFTSQWQAAAKLREFIELLGSNDKWEMTSQIYPKLMSNTYKVNDDLLASLGRVLTKAWNLNELEISAYVTANQRAIMVAPGLQGLFGTGITVSRAEFDIRMGYLRAGLPVLGAKRGAEMEMKEVPRMEF